MLKRAGIALAVTLFFTAMALGQNGHFDASVNGGAGFTNTASGNFVQQSATTGANVFGTIRFKFRPRHSFIFNYGRSNNSQTFQAGDNFHVMNTISEYTGAYMFSPLHNPGRFDPFFLAGGGGLSFDPSTTWVFFPDLANGTPNHVQVNLGAVKQTQLAFLYGLGVDYRLPKVPRLALRLQYRGLLYKAPDFKVDGTAGGGVSFFTGSRGHMAEPSIGLVFRF
jgi:hypothetical protein